MLKDSLLVDRTFKQANYMMSYISKNWDGEFFDAHNGRELIEDKTKWDDDYMNEQMVVIVDNFSKERWSHLKQIVRYLRPA
jgi:uncharacterized phage protein (TIGR02220 family)